MRKLGSTPKIGPLVLFIYSKQNVNNYNDWTPETKAASSMTVITATSEKKTTYDLGGSKSEHCLHCTVGQCTHKTNNTHKHTNTVK